MKILLVHNNYAKPSGEEAVVGKMEEIFRFLGHDVAQFRMSTAGMRDNLKGKVKGFISGIYSPAGVKSMADVLDKEKPDVVNVHNLYPFISPAALRECKKRGIPVIMTIHNYRLMCPTGLFMRDNKPCELCLQKGNEWGCVRYNCENSYLKSIGYAARNAVARINRHYYDCVDYFACLTDFQRQKLIEAGFSPSKIFVIPNTASPLPTPHPSPLIPHPSPLIPHPSSLTPHPPQPYIAYSGRISKEKGVDLIIEVARRHPEISFKFAGAVNNQEIISNLPSNIKLTGFLKGEELQNFYRDASFFIMASNWYEGFPMTILETSLYSKPMVAPAHGGFPEILDPGHNLTEENFEGIELIEDVSGLLFTPGSVDSLEKVIIKLWNDDNLTKKLGENAYKKLISQYSFKHISSLWQNLLDKAVQK